MIEHADWLRQQFLRNLWRWATGRQEQPAVRAPLVLSQMVRTEWSDRFERLMRNRLLLGAYRYGRIGDPRKPRYDRLGSMEKRLAAYRRTGNDELLVDIANLALLEFVEGEHPSKHFHAEDDSEHTREA